MGFYWFAGGLALKNMLTLSEVCVADLESMEKQLGRPVRDVLAVAARCVCGIPLVAVTSPRLKNGTPFPTVFYITNKSLSAAVSRLEAQGVMAVMCERLRVDEFLANNHLQAHVTYLGLRDYVAVNNGVGEVAEILGISAGGMPSRVKCLHVLVGYSLAVGFGVTLLGDEALRSLSPWWNLKECFCV